MDEEFEGALDEIIKDQEGSMSNEFMLGRENSSPTFDPNLDLELQVARVYKKT